MNLNKKQLFPEVVDSMSFVLPSFEFTATIYCEHVEVKRR